MVTAIYDEIAKNERSEAYKKMTESLQPGLNEIVFHLSCFYYIPAFVVV
jgi:hypothetical protein